MFISNSTWYLPFARSLLLFTMVSTSLITLSFNFSSFRPLIPFVFMFVKSPISLVTLSLSYSFLINSVLTPSRPILSSLSTLIQMSANESLSKPIFANISFNKRRSLILKVKSLKPKLSKV